MAELTGEESGLGQVEDTASQCRFSGCCCQLLFFPCKNEDEISRMNEVACYCGQNE